MVIFDIGQKVHIIERRYFNEDLRRHFVGAVVKSTENAIWVNGHAWIFDTMKGEFVQRPEKRERVIYPSDRSIINIISKEVDLDEIKYVTKPEIGLVVTDGKQHSLNINEFGVKR